MITKAVLTAVALTAIPTFALAQGFSGGELTIDTYGFQEGNNSTGVNYSGALEYAINRNISVAGDLSIYDFSLLSESITNLTIHGIYHLSDATSFGAFIGNDSAGGGGSSFFGVEAGHEAGKLDVEGYVALYDNDDDSTVLGASGGYQLTDNVSAIGDLGFADIGDIGFTRLSVGAEYEFNAGPSLYAEIGSVNSDIGDSTFIGLGASIQFGAERGTTFDRRGEFETINPGF